nr:immunoglobulin light chain junction region [Macaca mulatta]MOX22934.1 immunoglobulin light chain junction region [Macaca mulatta]
DYFCHSADSSGNRWVF